MNSIKVIGLVLLCISSVASAKQEANRESVEELMELMDAARMVDAMYSQVGQMFEGMAEQMGVTEAERPAFDKYMQKVAELMRKEMSWDKLKGPTIDIYVRNFSENEIKGLIEFYSSDVGKSMIEKMPIVMQESMQISQTMLGSAMPQIHALAAEMQAEIAESRKQAQSE